MQIKKGNFNDLNFAQMDAGEIAQCFEVLEFQDGDKAQQSESPFFKEFSGLYNSEPILLKYNCNNRELFSKCIHRLNSIYIVKSARLCIDNRIIKSLLTNKSINPGPCPMAEFTDNCDWNFFEKLSFEKISPYIFDGLLAELVSEGGIFFKSKKPHSEIVQLARAFSDSIIQGRFSDFIIYQVTEGWSAYFGRMGFDNMFILFDEGLGQFWILAKTDHD